MKPVVLPLSFDHRTWITPGALILDQYVFIEPVGEGRISMILKVRDRSGAECVVKTIKPSIREISSRHDFACLMAVTDREAQMQSAFHHPHIVQVLEYGFDPRLGICIVLEYASSGSLRRRLANQPLPVADALAIVEALLSALITLHAPSQTHPLGVVHLDLEPKNIVFGNTFGQHDVPKICDFHYSRRISQPPDPNDYIDENHPIDVRTDLMQVGQVLYEVLTLRNPHGMELDRLPDFLRPFVKKLVARDPEQRFASAIDTRRALEQLR